jgi:hypothetical protein
MTGHPWTAETVSELRRLWMQVPHLSKEQIGALMVPPRTPAAVQTAASKFGMPQRRHIRIYAWPLAAEKKCPGCREMFTPSDPSKRLCVPCRRRAMRAA